MKFSLFFELPVPYPRTATSERRVYKEALEQAILADRLGFHAVWSVEHHFLDEFSHCSNPEVLYGAIASRTERIRIGYGVRLMPAPYNHPVRSAESAAVLDLLSDGRVNFGTGRSATRVELEGFGIDPHETREMWQEAVEDVVGCWTHEEFGFDGKYWSMPPRRVLPKPLQHPHPPIFAASGSLDGHEMMGKLGLGLCSFSIGTSMENLKERLDRYRLGMSQCTAPLGACKNEHALAFTMVNCAPTREESHAIARDSFEWYARRNAQLLSEMSDWLEERSGTLGTFGYLDKVRAARTPRPGLPSKSDVALSFDNMLGNNSVIAGDPDDVLARARQYEAAGADELLCLFNPRAIAHEDVVRSMELMAEHVLPAFDA